MSPPPRPDRTTAWQRLELSSLSDRLATARDLLRQAAALTAAQEAQRLGAMADQQHQRMMEEQHGQSRRRRYR